MVLAAAATLVLLDRAREYLAPVDNYELVTPSLIAAHATGGQGDVIVSASVVEHATEVRVSVVLRRPVGSGPRIAIGIPIRVELQLTEPLGSRAVVDAAGMPVPLRTR